jgi:hypothetical protein
MEVLTLINVICMIVSIVVAGSAWVELRSFMKSTHKIEYVPLGDSPVLKKEPLRDQDLTEFDI